MKYIMYLYKLAGMKILNVYEKLYILTNNILREKYIN